MGQENEVMSSHLPLLVLSATVFVLLIFHSTAANAPSKLAEDTCNEASKIPPLTFQDCVDSLQKDPRTPTADIKLLAEISIQLGLTNVTDTQTFVTNLHNNGSTAPDLKKPLQQCLFWYQSVVASFKSALEELEEDPLTANYDVKVAGDDAKQCEDELARNSVQIPSVTTRNNYARLYSNIGVITTNKL